MGLVTLDEIYELEATLKPVKAVADERPVDPGIYWIEEEPSPNMPHKPDDFQASRTV